VPDRLPEQEVPEPEVTQTVPVDEAAQPSAIGAGLLVLGDQWNLLILRQAFLAHTRRFADWRDALGMSDSVLSGRLKELVAAGLLLPTSYKEGGRRRTEYLLTEKALELWSLLTVIWSWERTWVDSPKSGAFDLRHETCGAITDVELECGHCSRAPVTARDTSVMTGPDTTFRNVTVPRHHRRTVRNREHWNPASYLPETLEILGDRWSTVLLVAAFLRVRRFADFQNELGIAPGVLSERLSRFLALGVLTRDRSHPDRDSYRLTNKGLDFFAVFAFLVDWAQRWYPHPVPGGLRITHQLCGQPFRPVLRCQACHQQVERQAVHFVPGSPARSGRP
jgi:DNA-binding HxlR family transcriptional regulator